MHVFLIQPNGRLPAQPTYINFGVSPSHSNQVPPTGLGSTPSAEVRSVSPSSSSHDGGTDRIKQMEREIHLLRMSVNDKDAQLTQVGMMAL